MLTTQAHYARNANYQRRDETRNNSHGFDGSELYRQIASCGRSDHDIAETPIHPLQQPNILFFRLLADSLLVESKLLTLQNVTVTAAGLAGARGNNGEKTTGLELALDSRLSLTGVGEAGSLLLGDGGGLLLLGSLSLLLASTADGLTVVSLVPLTEGGSVNLDNGRLGQGVCADQLVVGGVEGHSNDTGLAGDTLGAPREVTGLETETTELLVTTTGADKVDALGANTGVGGLTTLLERSVERRHVRICNWYIESFLFFPFLQMKRNIRPHAGLIESYLFLR